MKSPIRPSLLPATILFTFAACADNPEDSSAPEPQSQLRDSAGIQIVENARPADGSRLDWRIGPEPAISIGVLEGEDPYMLFGVRDATKLPDGRIVVVNAGTMELRVFDALGTHLATWGGRGEGPGEFRNLVRVEPFPGDSIVAWEWLAKRMSVFDSQGNFVRTIRLARSLDDHHDLGPVTVLRDGTILASQDPISVDPVVVELWDGDGELRNSLGTHPGSERHVIESFTRMGLPKTFGRTFELGSWGELVVVSGTDRYEMKAFSTNGTLARIVRLDLERRAPTTAHIGAYLDHQVSRLASNSQTELFRELFESVPVAEHLPAFSSIMSDALNHLWVEEYEALGEERPGIIWTVFDPEGWVLGFVETPEQLEIYEIGGDYILGKTVSEELGVESVQVWPLERR